MADSKLSSLTALPKTSLNSGDEFYVAHSGGSYSIERSELDKQWVQTSLANVANGYAALDGTGAVNAKVIILHDTATNLASVVLDAGRMAWATDTDQLFVGDGSTAISALTPINPAAVVLAPASGINQTVRPTAANASTNLTLSGTGTGNATFVVRGAAGGSGFGTIDVLGNGGTPHKLIGSGGVSFDQNAANGGLMSDGNGNWSVGGLLGSLSPQAISVTADTDVVASFVVCSGTTTAPKLPAVANGAMVLVKNMGSGNCVVKQNSGDSGSRIVPTSSTTAASTLTLASGTQGLFFSDLTNWYRVS